MSDVQPTKEDTFTLEMNVKEQKIFRSAMKALGGIISSRPPLDFSQQELDDLRALRERLPEKS